MIERRRTPLEFGRLRVFAEYSRSAAERRQIFTNVTERRRAFTNTAEATPSLCVGLESDRIRRPFGYVRLRSAGLLRHGVHTTERTAKDEAAISTLFSRWESHHRHGYNEARDPIALTSRLQKIVFIICSRRPPSWNALRYNRVTISVSRTFRRVCRLFHPLPNISLPIAPTMADYWVTRYNTKRHANYCASFRETLSSFFFLRFDF